jgi:hypothetical protein
VGAEAQAIKAMMEADTIRTPKSFFIKNLLELPFECFKQAVLYKPAP